MFRIYCTSTEDSQSNQNGSWFELPITRAKMIKLHSELFKQYHDWTFTRTMTDIKGLDLKEFIFGDGKYINIVALNTLLLQIQKLSTEDKTLLEELQSDGCNIRTALKKLEEFKLHSAIIKFVYLADQYNIPLEDAIQCLYEPKQKYEHITFTLKSCTDKS